MARVLILAAAALMACASLKENYQVENRATAGIGAGPGVRLASADTDVEGRKYSCDHEYPTGSHVTGTVCRWVEPDYNKRAHDQADLSMLFREKVDMISGH
jgi:hypothetical protein